MILSMHNEVPIAQRALRSGANGYLTKDRDPETLLAAIRRVAAGGRYIDVGLAEQMAFAATGLGHIPPQTSPSPPLNSSTQPMVART